METIDFIDECSSCRLPLRRARFKSLLTMEAIEKYRLPNWSDAYYPLFIRSHFRRHQWPKRNAPNFASDSSPLSFNANRFEV
jgi:hypothetical protein